MWIRCKAQLRYSNVYTVLFSCFRAKKTRASNNNVVCTKENKGSSMYVFGESNGFSAHHPCRTVFFVKSDLNVLLTALHENQRHIFFVNFRMYVFTRYSGFRNFYSTMMTLVFEWLILRLNGKLILRLINSIHSFKTNDSWFDWFVSWLRLWYWIRLYRFTITTSYCAQIEFIVHQYPNSHRL